MLPAHSPFFRLILLHLNAALYLQLNAALPLHLNDCAAAGDGMDRWLCMTLLVAVEGKVKLPKIGSTYELKQVS